MERKYISFRDSVQGEEDEEINGEDRNGRIMEELPKWNGRKTHASQLKFLKERMVIQNLFRIFLYLEQEMFNESGRK